MIERVGKKARVVFLGLANAGKSTLMDLLATGRLVQHPPTNFARSKELQLGSVTFTVYDLGGQRQIRRVWSDYYPAVDAVVFVVDAAARDTFAFAKDELQNLLADDQLTDCPVVVLGNKIDLTGAVNETELKAALGLNIADATIRIPGSSLGRDRSVKVFMSSLLWRQGYSDALHWISQQL